MGYHRELEAAIESMKAMRKRGIRILPGGDYGFAWTPHGTNAKDLEYFVKYVGMSTMEALLSATAWGGPMMKHGQGSSATSAKAAWPTSCWSTATRWPTSPCCRTRRRILAVMKDGEFHRAPPVRAQRAHAPTALGRLRRHDDGRRRSSPTSASSTAPAQQPYTGSVLVQGNRIRAGRPQHGADRARPARP